MPIKKRLTETERVSKTLGKGWEQCFMYGTLAGIVKFTRYDASPKNIARALKQVRGWQGASYQDKVVIFTLSSIMWRSFGESPLTDFQYDKLFKHLLDHENDILASAGLHYHQAFVWDHRVLARHSKGALLLPETPNSKPKKTRLKKHRRSL